MTKRPIFYDTETTGIKVDHDRIIELAAYDPVQERVFERLINPGQPIPAEATAIHHITNEMVASCPSFDQVASEFMQFCDGDIVLVAHNGDSFDLPFLKREFARHKIEFPAWPSFDTLKWARRYRADIPRHTLQFLREIYGIPANNAHRAMDDVKVLHQVFCYMTDDLPFPDVFALMNQPRLIQHMPFGKYQGTPLGQLPKDYIRWLLGSGALEKDENKELRTSFEKVGLLAAT